jgi:hypothetical protein
MSTTTGRTPRNSGVPTRQQLDELDALLKKMLELPVQAVEEANVPPPPVIPTRPSLRPVPATEPIRTLPSAYTVVETASPEVPGTPLPADPVQEQAAARLREEAEWQQYQSSWQPSAQTWGPLAETWRQTQPLAVPAVPEGANRLASEMPGFPTESYPSVRTQTVEIAEPLPQDRLASPIVPEPATPPVSRPEMPAQAPAQSTNGHAVSVLLWPLVILNGCFDLPTYLLGPVGRWLRSPDGGGWLLFLGLLSFVAAALVVLMDGIGWNW